jgi:hypothetical protein
MRIPATWKSELDYSRQLMDAGLDAVASVREASPNQKIVPEYARAARDSWAPAVVGAAVGILCGYMVKKSSPARAALVGGCVGGAIAFGASLTWGSRKTTGAIARQAAKNISKVNDAHWLEKHPVAYA